MTLDLDGATGVADASRHASQSRPRRWQTVSAFAIIYLVWGSTFLAIRVGEDLGLRAILGTILVLISVVVITTTPAKKAAGLATVTANSAS